MFRDAYDVLNPRLTRGEYWLLDVAVELRTQIRSLVHPQIEEFFNRQGHGLDRQELIGVLTRLFDNDLIEATHLDEDATSSMSGAQIEAAMEEEDRWHATCYGLTATGGQLWEAFAAPSWNRYLDESSRYSEHDEDTMQICLTSANPDLIHSRISSLPVAAQATAITETLTPWRTTYWKTLPIGYCVSLTVDSAWCEDYDSRRSWQRPRWYDWGG